MTQKQQNIVSKVNTILKVDIQNESTLWLSERKSLMKLIGILGMLLPFLLYGFLRWNTGHVEELESISHYYFTRSNPIFIIVISLLAIFLMLYKYKKSIDFYLSFFAGLAALLLLLFPTSSIVKECVEICNNYTVTYIDYDKCRVSFHYICAAVFLVILNYMCFFLFTRKNKSEILVTAQKKKRNIIFYVCGSLMTLALLVMFLKFLDKFPEDFYINNNLTFWMETLALEAFGFSWLVKGEFILKDK